MEKDLNIIFETKRKQVLDYHDEWSQLQKQILQLLKNTELEEISVIEASNLALQDVIGKFKYELDNPLITLATTGTTSSGKSSLVNLLCGSEIMPVAVLEMSAGTVLIDYHPSKRNLKIPHVEGVPSEYCGEWSDLDDLDIRRRLEQLMNAYRQLREENREPPAPRIELQYPARLGTQSESTGLPKGFRLRIIDLPGVKYVADDHNRQITRKEITPALCLVTYNSEETDPTKQQVLLDEIVTQVRELGGTPARMLFILNRIDVFRRDANWEEKTNEFSEIITQKIQSSVALALPEYQEEAKKLRVQPLSTYPALCAYQALNKSELCIQALERIDSKFGTLIPDEIIDELPRKINKWKNFERKRVAESVWISSFGYDFDKMLKEHIENNIPQLLLPHLIKTVADSFTKGLTDAHQIIYAHINATNDRYQTECEKLKNRKRSLKKLRETSEQKLLDVVSFSYENEEIIEELTDIAIELQKLYELPKDSLIPLHDWSLQLGNSIESFFSSIHQAITEGKSPQGELFESLSSEDRKKVSQTLKNLDDSGYRKYANDGGHIDTYNQSEKDRLKNMNHALNTLAEVLAKNLKWVLDRTSEREAIRIQNSLQLLIEGYARHINKKAQSIAPDLAGLSITPSGIVRVKQKLLLNFQLTAGFHVHKKQKDVKVGTKNVKVGTKNVKVGTKDVKVGTKRVWYTLWIKKENIYEKEDVYEKQEVYEKQDVYEKRPHDAAVIPSIMEIFSNFIMQAKASRHEIEFIRWLEEQLDGFLKGIEKYQEDLLKTYQYRLDKVMKRVEQEKEFNIGKWQPIEDKTGNLLSRLPEILKVI